MVKLKIIFLLLIMSSGIAPYSKAQEIKVVSTGQGVTEDEATKTALRSALEDAYGTFISSSTKIENNVLVSDEIVSLAQGNIHKYDVISSIQLVNGLYSVTVESLISLNKLAAYCQNQGMSVSFNGKAFGMELKIREFNRQNEIKILKNLCLQLVAMNPKIYDCFLETSDPKIVDHLAMGPTEDWLRSHISEWNNKYEGAIRIEAQILSKSNSNSKLMNELVQSTFKSISLSKAEIKMYEKIGMKYYKKAKPHQPIGVNRPTKFYYFRDKNGIKIVEEFLARLYTLMSNNWILKDNTKGEIEGINNGRLMANDEYASKGVLRYRGTLYLYYTVSEIEKLESISVEPFNNEAYETFIKPELIDIIAKFDDIE